MSHTGNNFRTQNIDDEIEVQLCENCSAPYAVAYSENLERWIFLCLKCSSSCSTIVLEDGKELEITT